MRNFATFGKVLMLASIVLFPNFVPWEEWRQNCWFGFVKNFSLSGFIIIPAMFALFVNKRLLPVLAFVPPVLIAWAGMFWKINMDWFFCAIFFAIGSVLVEAEDLYLRKAVFAGGFIGICGIFTGLIFFLATEGKYKLGVIEMPMYFVIYFVLIFVALKGTVRERVHSCEDFVAKMCLESEKTPNFCGKCGRKLDKVCYLPIFSFDFFRKSIFFKILLEVSILTILIFAANVIYFATKSAFFFLVFLGFLSVAGFLFFKKVYGKEFENQRPSGIVCYLMFVATLIAMFFSLKVAIFSQGAIYLALFLGILATSIPVLKMAQVFSEN